ncbi:type I-F CRISPR-associated endoribonuclease Cas6/Csy4 [Acinetobacter sp.]|uniref:type I-F CRISPR-associated endoribonuclease Cas6/Csy4 n=1 Tax=Acinetobacter sp. TaxID=472 RepID=UPI0031DAFF43
MNYYIELTLIDSSDFSFYEIWSKFYTQLHLALVEQKDENGNTPFGMSFPEYKIGQDKNGKSFFHLGSKLRVFAQTELQLEQLNLDHWLERLTDYVHIKRVREVPAGAYPVHYERVRPKDSKLKRAAHQAQRRNTSLEESLKHFEGYQEETLNLPFVQVNSLTNSSKFNLFIRRHQLAEPVMGNFNTYGLSKNATVPEWSD